MLSIQQVRGKTDTEVLRQNFEVYLCYLHFNCFRVDLIKPAAMSVHPYLQTYVILTTSISDLNEIWYVSRGR